MGGLPGWNSDGFGNIFVFKIVDHAPVVRCGKGFGVLAYDIPNNGRFAGTFDACHKYVVSGTLHVQTEIDGLNRSLLTDDDIQRFDFGSVFEIKYLCVTNTS